MQPDWTDEKAEAAVAKIFEDLRDRRFLKWLFKEDVDAEHCIQRDGPVYALDKDVQDEIAATWARICATALREAEARGRRTGLEEAAQVVNAAREEGDDLRQVRDRIRSRALSSQEGRE